MDLSLVSTWVQDETLVAHPENGEKCECEALETLSLTKLVIFKPEISILSLDEIRASVANTVVNRMKPLYPQ